MIKKNSLKSHVETISVEKLSARDEREDMHISRWYLRHTDSRYHWETEAKQATTPMQRTRTIDDDWRLTHSLSFSLRAQQREPLHPAVQARLPRCTFRARLIGRFGEPRRASVVFAAATTWRGYMSSRRSPRSRCGSVWREASFFLHPVCDRLARTDSSTKGRKEREIEYNCAKNLRDHGKYEERRFCGTFRFKHRARV